MLTRFISLIELGQRSEVGWFERSETQQKLGFVSLNPTYTKYVAIVKAGFAVPFAVSAILSYVSPSKPGVI